MNKIFLSPEAQNDLIEIRRYITDDLDNLTAANNTIANITKRIRTLAEFAEIGAPLSSVINFYTDYRFLVCSKYIAFYRTENKEIYVDRILYGRRDYLKILFGDLPDGSEQK
jgi:toxin ParE1/3/4